MKKLALLGITLLTVLSACQKANVERSELVRPDAGPSKLQGLYGGGIFFEVFRPADLAANDVAKVTLSFNDRTYSASQISEAPSYYRWYSVNPCHDLPQGTQINMKFQMYNNKDEIVNEQSRKIDINTCG